MKLNQNELAAMATRAYQKLHKHAELAQDQLNAVQDVENAKIVATTIEHLKEFDKAFKAMPAPVRKTIQSKYGDSGRYSENRIFGQLAKGVNPEDMIRSMRKTQTTVKLPEQPSQYNKFSNKLYVDMTIAQIDSDNVDEMLNKVARRYMKLPSGQAVPRINDKP